MSKGIKIYFFDINSNISVDTAITRFGKKPLFLHANPRIYIYEQTNRVSTLGKYTIENT